MKNKSRLIAYIFLNIIISAATTFGVLWLWDQIHPRPETIDVVLTESANSESSTSRPAQEDTQENMLVEPSLTFIDEDSIQVIIRTIVGAGNLDVEYVEIFNQSEGPVDLSGWQLKDENDNTFLF
ncbi:MAG: lamin tail domain-containing protein, partial [Anaerolineales bacterium]